MSSLEVDTVKAEKAAAMRKYNRDRNCKFCLLVIFYFSLCCCTFSWFPAVQEMVSAYSYLFNQKIVVLFVVNALLFVIYFLSTRDGNSDAVSQPDLYAQYVCLSSSARRKYTTEHEEKQLVVSPAPELNVFCDKEVVCCEKFDRAPVEEKCSVRCLAVTTTTESYTEKKSFRRTRSEKYGIEKKKKRSHHRSELRRSETDNGRELVVAGGYTPARKSMQDLNNEEFRLKIESFIASTKKVLRDENVALLMEERRKSFTATAITYV